MEYTELITETNQLDLTHYEMRPTSRKGRIVQERFYFVPCNVCGESRALRMCDIRVVLKTGNMCQRCSNRIKGQLGGAATMRKYGRKAFMHIIQPSLLKREMSKPERKVNAALLAAAEIYNFTFEREYIVESQRSAVIVDFYIPSLKLAIEVNTRYTHRDPRRDMRKVNYVRRLGHSVLVLWEQDFNDAQGLMTRIERTIKRRQKKLGLI